MDVKISVTGVKEIDAVLTGLPLQLNHSVMQSAHADAAKPLVEKAKLLAPEGINGYLVDSIGTVKPGLKRANEVGEVLTGPRRGKYKGHAGHLVERGTKQRKTSKGWNRGIMPKHPFMEPAFEATKDQVLGRINESIGKKLFAFMSRTIKKSGGSVV